MIVSEIRMLEVLKQKFKLSEDDAKEIAREISESESILNKQIDNKFDSRESSIRNDINILRNEINQHFANKEDLSNTKSEILKWTFIIVLSAVLLNIFSVIGGVVAIINTLG